VIVLTRQDVLAHQREVPWAELYQVEQDLLLCLAIEARRQKCSEVLADPALRL
jgi:hypothetical protein